MNKLTFILSLFVFLFLSCKKEDLFDTKVGDLYVIQPNDSDPVKSRIYDVYVKYGVAVFFQDSVGQYFVRNDINGNPVYRTEKLDLGWVFTSYNNSNYTVGQIQSDQEKLEALDYMEKYLNTAAKPLYPFSILLARQLTETSKTGQETVLKDGSAQNFFRTLVLTDKYPNQDTIEHFKGIVRRLVRTKLNNYPNSIAKFGAVSKSEWYGVRKFNTLNPKIDPSIQIGVLYSDAIEKNYRIARGMTDAQIEALKTQYREICGQFGFVASNGGQSTHATVLEDLDWFVFEMQRTDKTEFRRRWGSYPLVMKKYEIVHEVIKIELGVDL